MSTNTDIDTHELNGTLPTDIPDDLKDFLTQDEDLTYDEVILQQQSVYQSYQESSRNRVEVTTDDDDDDDDTGDSSSTSENEDESSRDESVISQEAMDEAYARSLQELGEEFDEFFISEFNISATNGMIESPISDSSSSSSSSDSTQDDVDPDNMRYEELLNLAETVGVENVGLSAAHISQLPTSIYTSGMFSNNKEENCVCVICQESFKFGKRLITLPCFHQYHSKCIVEWLKLKKNCPICQKEVV